MQLSRETLISLPVTSSAPAGLTFVWPKWETKVQLLVYTVLRCKATGLIASPGLNPNDLVDPLTFSWLMTSSSVVLRDMSTLFVPQTGGLAPPSFLLWGQMSRVRAAGRNHVRGGICGQVDACGASESASITMLGGASCRGPRGRC